MRNFSTSARRSDCFALDSANAFDAPDFVKCQLALMIAMDANPNDMNSSEEAVLADFIAWFRQAKEDDLLGVSFRRPVFFYVNLNSGYSVAVVLVDAKGKIDF